MLEISDQAAQHKRATWVALRTLRQRPRIVGNTDEGEPVYEIRSVRLVMRRDATHFNRLVACSRCGRDLFGEPVFGSADLTRFPASVACNDCDGSPSAPWFAPEVRPAPAPAAPQASEPLRPVTDPDATNEDRLTAIESDLHAIAARLADLAAAEKTESDARARAEGITRAGLQRNVLQRLAALRSEMAASSDAATVRMGALEEEVRVSGVNAASPRAEAPAELSAMSGAIDETREELQKLSRSQDETRDQMQRFARSHDETREELQMVAELHDAAWEDLQAIAQSHDDLATTQEELKRQILQLATQLARAPKPPPRPVIMPAPAPEGDPDPGGVLAWLEHQLWDAERRMADRASSVGDGC